jgi:type IV secretion system protein VirD4
MKKLFIQTVPYVIIFIIILQVIPRIPFEMPLADVLIAFISTALFRLFTFIKSRDAKKYRKGIEYGSARFGTPADIKPYIDSDFDSNVLLTQTERLMMNSRPANPAYARNKNVLVIGGSGSGKTRFFVKPNLMQMHSSYCVSDPKGSVVIECGQLLQRGGYEIKILNTINFNKSMKYNPFAYIKSEKDILKLVSTIISNTKGEGEKSAEDFWVKAEKLYYTALIGYIFYEGRDDEKNFITLLDMINASDAREDDEDYKNPVDLMFERLAAKDPEHFAVLQYAKYKMAAGKTAKSILISCGARLAPFDIKELRALMEYDELELDTLGDRKTALFIITSDTDSTFDFLSSMVVMQMFNTLCTKADDEYGGRLPVHVRLNEQIQEGEDTGRWLMLIRDYADIRELDSATLNQLIKKIVVYEDFDNDVIRQTVEIHFNFISQTDKHKLVR